MYVDVFREAFDMGLKTAFTNDEILDIHSISSVMKTYFRELPNPLLTYQLYSPFVVRTRASVF